MTILEMLGQSGLLTVLGMCVVFSFIIILIISMHLLHKVISLLKLDKDTSKVPSKPKVAPEPQQTDIRAIVAAIAIAIKDKS